MTAILEKLRRKDGLGNAVFQNGIKAVFWLNYIHGILYSPAALAFFT
jgi:hypothetical protein